MVVADVPGVAQEALEVRVDDNVLTIRMPAMLSRVTSSIGNTSWSTSSGSLNCMTKLTKADHSRFGAAC